MREIKFRAWDGEFMIRWDNLCEISCHELSEGVICDSPTDGEQEKIKVMQYTGLKDKNGKEIYEGDILKTEYQDADGKWLEYIGYVWYRNPDFVIRQDLDNGGYQYQDFYRAVKIIGNIYENPELLK